MASSAASNSAAAAVDSKAPEQRLDAEQFRTILKRRFFVAPAFEIYGGVGGLMDLGPPGCALKDNIIAAWRRHFVLEENMLEIATTCLTPSQVLQTSGHVDKFFDYMVKDSKTGKTHRADKLLEDWIDRLFSTEPNMNAEKKAKLQRMQSHADAMSIEELTASLRELNVTAMDTGNAISDPFPFNLMFSTQIGPVGNQPGFLRPETAQNIFVNFNRLLDYNGSRMPFAAATIGLAFRNEIAPRNGLMRVREFTLAEIEHFVNPNNKAHPKFASVAGLTFQMLPRSRQEDGSDRMIDDLSLGDAVAQGVIDNETLAYFIGRTYLFLVSIGIKREKLRFRQHKSTEMAHYATDCWDAEILITETNEPKWQECVGHADRSCFDLTRHAEFTKSNLHAYELYPEPRLEQHLKAVINKSQVGKAFKAQAKRVIEHLDALPQSQALELEATLEAKGEAPVQIAADSTVTIRRDMASFQLEEKKVQGRNYVPGVIEPSFGIGRILHAVLEHNFLPDPQDSQRVTLTLPPLVAPIKCSVLNFMTNARFIPLMNDLAARCVRLGLACKNDDTGAAIGRKYARTDELGVPYAITLDYETFEQQTVTLRDRDTRNQIRVPFDDAPALVRSLVGGEVTWQQLWETFPQYLDSSAQPATNDN